jgi:hypothetical protein
MEIIIWESGGYCTMRNLYAAIYVFSVCFFASVSVRGENAGMFTKAIEQAKQFVIPVVCFGENPDTKVAYLISVEGTGFFVSGDPRVITAGHVAKAFNMKDRIPHCAFPAIYVPIDGWDSSSSKVQIRYVLITVCDIGESLDIAACYLAEDVTNSAAIKAKPKAADLDGSIYPDGTPVAFTGFPLSFVQPITSQGIIGTYRGPNPTLGPTELVVDKNAWPGASGSPIFDVNGRVVGMIIQRGFNDSSGLAFAIPSGVIKKFLSDNPPTQKPETKDHSENHQQ